MRPREANPRRSERAPCMADGAHARTAPALAVAVERAKQEAHDRFETTLKKHGLADRLDPPPA